MIIKHKSLSISETILLRNIFLYIFLILASITCILPLLWMISTSLKSGNIIFAVPPKWLPDGLHFENYVKAVVDISFLRYFFNTMFITCFKVFAEVFVSALVAFGFAKFDFPGKNILFLLLLSTIMIPSEVMLIPVFQMFSSLGWVNTYLPLIIPAFAGQPVFIFLLRQFFMSQPEELMEAATIDGANKLTIFFKIYLPISKPALITIGILSFQGSWNDLLTPLIYLNDSTKFTLQLGLAMFIGLTKIEWGPLMAASILTLLPVLIVFFFAQKYFVEGISFSGTKG